MKRSSRGGKQEETWGGVRMQNHIKWDLRTLHTMQRTVLADPSVFHLSKLSEGNRKEKATEEQSDCITC